MSKKQRAGGTGGGGLPPTVTEDERILGAMVVAEPVAWLWVQRPPGLGGRDLEVQLPLVAEFTIGREGEARIDRPTISRVHAVASRLGQGLVVRLPALAPKNGIEVRGVRLRRGEQASVAPGETWRLGSTVVVALTEAQARGRRVLSSLLGTALATSVIDTAARGGSFGVVGEDPAIRRAVALAVAEVTPRRTGRRGEILSEGGTHFPHDRETVRDFADAVSSGLAIVEQEAVMDLGLSADDRGALERYLTDGVRAIQLIWCAGTVGEVRGRLGLVSERLTWVTVPTVAELARAGALPALFERAFRERGTTVEPAELFARAELRPATLAAYGWPDGLAEFQVCVAYILDQHAGVAVQATAEKVGLSRHALRRLVQSWQGGEGPRRRGLFARMLRRDEE
ncbi:MAG: FHA domain-containing protein [Kofleriaceae bacterium]|nr:FHA domain-containing protein [Kofleriaceae bacterium]MBP9167985.1 FHA domain-containing protein [Kofleriaceae bacterium]MBP9856819.1 FHA domain-containing protein [Kofleriaceae bacterium]